MCPANNLRFIICDSSQFVKKTEEPPANVVQNESNKELQCSYCLKFFIRPSVLKTHMYKHTKEKPFQCSSPNCGRRFSVASNLRRHLKIHQQALNKNNKYKKLTAEDRLHRVHQHIMKSKTTIVETTKNGKVSLPGIHDLLHGKCPHYNWPRFHPPRNNNDPLLLSQNSTGYDNFDSLVSYYSTPPNAANGIYEGFLTLPNSGFNCNRVFLT